MSRSVGTCSMTTRLTTVGSLDDDLAMEHAVDVVLGTSRDSRRHFRASSPTVKSEQRRAWRRENCSVARRTQLPRGELGAHQWQRTGV